ncbi:MAG: thiamine phosphate synthase [Parvularculaceae bacterium]
MSRTSAIYLITPPAIMDVAAFAALLDETLSAAPVACLQLRLKDVSDDDVLAAAAALLPVARRHDVHFLINDRPDLALKAGADGVHIGQEDAGLAEARRLLGPDRTIGVTCHDSYHLAMEAGEGGADYVAFGAFFPTRTKEAPARAKISLIEDWSAMTTVPCVAIGGVTAENCAPLVRAGADFLAVSGAVWGAEDGPARSIARLAAAIETSRHE